MTLSRYTVTPHSHVTLTHYTGTAHEAERRLSPLLFPRWLNAYTYTHVRKSEGVITRTHSPFDAAKKLEKPFNTRSYPRDFLHTPATGFLHAREDASNAMETHVIYVKSDSAEEANHRIDQCLDYVLDNLILADSAPRERMKNNLEKVHAVQITLGERDDHDLFVLVNRRDLSDDERDGTPASTLIAKKITAEDADNIVIPSIHDETINGIETIVESGANVHYSGTGLTVHGTKNGLNPVLRRSLRRLTGDRTDAAAIIDGIPHSGGRPPIGCRVEDSVLRPGEDYYRVCEILQDVKDGVTSKVDAADEIGCSRKTIDNALERTELYQLD